LAERHADGVLLFTCNGRWSRLFSKPDHDAGVIGDLMGDPPISGFFAAGELGPVGGRNFVHGFTASMALFEERTPASQPLADALAATPVETAATPVGTAATPADTTPTPAVVNAPPEETSPKPS
ncbi:MAG TPA: hypothetical protein VHT75_08395, partial [Acidimicrobiales bacterium]|nr:hypothetical protein [Acidimicrobiales bacterium]